MFWGSWWPYNDAFIKKSLLAIFWSNFFQAKRVLFPITWIIVGSVEIKRKISRQFWSQWLELTNFIIIIIIITGPIRYK